MARALRALVASLVLVPLAAGCADRPVVWFENQRDDTVTVSIDGDRLVVLRPHATEYLPYSTAAWAWQRRVDVATFPTGVPLSSSSYDAGDLAEQRWRIHIRP